MRDEDFSLFIERVVKNEQATYRAAAQFIETKEGRACWQAANIALAEERFLLAWSFIPEPKEEYDYAQVDCSCTSVSGGLIILVQNNN